MRPATRAITLLVAGAFFMELLDGSVIATAMPRMGEAFGVSPVALNLGISAYLLSLAVLIPISGWVASRFGSRTVFAGAIALFTLASLLCALSDSLPSFIAARLLQGAGGAAMVPVGRLIVLRTVEKHELVRAIGTIVWPALVAPVLGPPLGGLIVSHGSWRWIFLINIPLGLAAIALTLILIPNDRPQASERPLDWRGFLLSGGALVLLVYGLDALGSGQQPPAVALPLAAAGLALGVAAVRHLKRAPAPLLDLSSFRVPTFAVVAWGGSILRAAIGTMPFLLPLLFQLGFGLDPLASGALVMFVFAGNLAMKIITTRTLRRFGFRSVMIGNGVLAALAIAACALLTPATPHWLVAVVLFAGGGFRSLQFTALSSIQFADVPAERMTDANTLASVLQQLTLGLGVVIGAGLLNASAWAHGHAAHGPDLGDFRLTFYVVALLALVGLIDSVRLDRNAGRHVSGHRTGAGQA